MGHPGQLSPRSSLALSSPIRRLGVAGLFALVFCCLSTLAAAESVRADRGADPGVSSWRADGVGFEAVTDPALEVLRDPALWQQLDAAATLAERGELSARGGLSDLLDRPFRLEHRVPLGGGQFLSVIESFTLRAWLRPVHRATLLLPGSVFNAEHYTIDAEGYDAHDILNAEGWFAFSVDYLGVDESFLPVQGQDASFEANLEALRILVRYIRFFRQVPRVDLLGAGYGGGLAAELAVDDRRIRRVVMNAMLYREVAGGPLSDPGFVAFLESIEEGYFFAPGEGSFIFMEGAPQAALDYVAETQTGFYPTPNFLVGANRPFFDPTHAAVPGLVLYGLQDFIGLESDIRDLAAEWGSAAGLDGAELVVRPDFGHAPRTGDPAEAAGFWDEVLDFLR